MSTPNTCAVPAASSHPHQPPSQVGTAQVRPYQLDGDTLTLAGQRIRGQEWGTSMFLVAITGAAVLWWRRRAVTDPVTRACSGACR